MQNRSLSTCYFLLLSLYKNGANRPNVVLHKHGYKYKRRLKGFPFL